MPAETTIAWVELLVCVCFFETASLPGVGLKLSVLRYVDRLILRSMKEGLFVLTGSTSWNEGFVPRLEKFQQAMQRSAAKRRLRTSVQHAPDI